MRYVVGFVLLLLALGAMPLVGCSESAQCRDDKDCDDQNACTDDRCYSVPVRCDHMPVQDWTHCDFDGLDGICISGVCGENPCDDGNECTDDLPGDECIYMPFTGRSCDWNGESGVCIDGVCEEDPCKGVVCDDGDLCTNDWCWLGECRTPPVNCSDRNTCTDDTCDPDTGECDYTPVPDGTGCCLEWGPCSGICFCIPGPCPPECVDGGQCQNGECVPD
jgi:hypothetical protein